MGVRDAIAHGAPNPVPPHEAQAVMHWLEHGLHAVRQNAPPTLA